VDKLEIDRNQFTQIISRLRQIPKAKYGHFYKLDQNMTTTHNGKKLPVITKDLLPQNLRFPTTPYPFSKPVGKYKIFSHLQGPDNFPSCKKLVYQIKRNFMVK
jgi:hypothetical protein